MCGITGCILRNTKKSVFDTLYSSLEILQNRGYDSCGIINGECTTLLRSASSDGKCLQNLLINKNSFSSTTRCGIGHTRWATNGKKTIENAHPHMSYDKKFAIVHNGIIENAEEIKKTLFCRFSSQTDSEVIVHWIASRIISPITKHKIESLLRVAHSIFIGNWAISLVCSEIPNTIFITRNHNPILIGISKKMIMITSESSGFSTDITEYTILQNKQVLSLDVNTTKEYIEKKNPTTWFPIPIQQDNSLGLFPKYMIKEIYEQSSCIYKPCNWKYITKIQHMKEFQKIHIDDISKYDVLFIGCGTSYHSGVASIPFFTKARSVRSIIASEFTKYDIPKNKNILCIFLSQSGETLDTYKSFLLIKKYDYIQTIAVVNVENSLLARECDYVLYTNVGKEVGVASTKSYISQIIVLHLFSLYTNSNIYIPNEYNKISLQIKEICKKFAPYIEINNTYTFVCPKPIYKIVKSLHNSNHGFILSSGNLLSVCKEGSLKIKEIGRIFIQGFPTSSLKHGPFALVEKGIPIIISLQKGNQEIFSKTQSAIDELYGREATIFVITDIDNYTNHKVEEVLYIPYNPILYNILHIIPYQIISYFLAEIRGLDCDKPRNLAKCVTTH